MHDKTSSLHWLALAKLGFMAAAGFSMMLILPIVLGGLVDELQFSNVHIGWVAALNSLGIALGALYVPLSGGRFRLRRSLRGSILGLLIVDAFCVFLSTPPTFYLFRFIAGCFGGVIYAGILRALAGLPQPGRGFSIYVIVYCSWSSLLFFGAPYVLEWIGVKGLFLYIAISSLIALFFSPILKNYEAKIVGVGTDALTYLLKQKIVLASLVSYMLLMAGCGAIWAYIERIGHAHGLSSEFIGGALSISELSGILAGILAFRLGGKMGVAIPIAGSLLVIALCIAALGFLPAGVVYFISVFIFSGAWAFIIAYYQKVQAIVDFEGKIVALGATINLFGRALGPAMASFFIVGNNFNPVIWYSLITFGLCLAVIWPTLVKIDRNAAFEQRA